MRSEDVLFWLEHHIGEHYQLARLVSGNAQSWYIFEMVNGQPTPEPVARGKTLDDIVVAMHARNAKAATQGV